MSSIRLGDELGSKAKICAVYMVRQVSTGKAYVGSSTDVEARRVGHWSTLRAGTNGSITLQDAWNAAGESDFEFLVVEECSAESRLSREQHWLDQTKDAFNATWVRRSGRPALPSDLRRKTVKTRVEPRKIASISLYAATRGMSVGQLIDEYVARHIGDARASTA